MPVMGGWITWCAIGGNILLAVYNLYVGNTEVGMGFLTAALALLGIGRKIEKTK